MNATSRNRHAASAALTFAVAIVLFTPRAASAADPASAPTHDRWFVVTIQGQRAGWVHEQSETTGDRITTDIAMQMSVQRSSTLLKIEMSSRFVESTSGEPISAVSTQKAGATRISKTITFEEDRMLVVDEQGDRRQERSLLKPLGDWLTPAAAARHVAKRIAAGDTRIAFSTLDPSTSLQPIDIVIKQQGREEIDLYGRKVVAMKRDTFTSALPGMKVVEFTDAHGRPLHTKINFGRLAMEMIAADRTLATSPIDPPELLMQTLITPGFRIKRPRQLRQATFRLSVSDGEMPDLPDSPVQRVERLDNRSVRVAIALDRGEASEDPKPPAITHNIMIDGKDEVIVGLARTAIREANLDDNAGDAERVEVLRKFVGKHIQRADLSVGMASASEVARARVGDCTEHGVLLAALIKSIGVPARVASGIIYVDRFAGEKHVFGYHMWTQAWVDGRWVDLDATIHTPYDAAHILLSTSDLGDEHVTNDMVVLGPLLGRLAIERVDSDR